MTSLQSAYSQIPSNKLYVNIASGAAASFTDSNLSTLYSSGDIYTALNGAAGTVILRDMGKTLYLPSPTVVPVGAVAGISTVLRKVQLVPTATLGRFGVGGSNAAATGPTSDYITGYIQLGALTYGGGNGQAVKFARLN